MTRVVVHGRNLDVPDELREHISQRMLSTLSRFKERVGRISVRVEGPSENRPPHQPLVCQVTATMDTGWSVIIEERGERFVQVIERAAERLNRTLSCRFQPGHPAPPARPKTGVTN